MANANGEGSIYKRMRGWRHVGYIGAISYTDDTGQPKRDMVYGKTRADVRGRMKQVRERVDNGAALRDSKRTLADWLAHWRATTLAASDRKESTRELYANLSRRHLEPEPFGAIRLDKLRPSDIEALVLAMRAKTKPGKRTEKNLNPEPAPRHEDGQIANWRSRHIVAGGEWGMSLAEVYEWLTGGDQ